MTPASGDKRLESVAGAARRREGGRGFALEPPVETDSGPAAHRVVIFADSANPFSAQLTNAFLRAAGARSDVLAVAVVDAAPVAPRSRAVRLLRTAAGSALIRFADPATAARLKHFSAVNVLDVARRHAVPALAPPGRGLGHPALPGFLGAAFRPTLALALGCRRILGRELLGLFAVAVNFHDGLLPRYGGLRATAWSVYNGEPETGFTFHLMNEAPDAGPLLLQGRITRDPAASESEIMHEKILRAGGLAGEVLGMMTARREGAQQHGERSYFSARELEAITTIPDPSLLTWTEIERRLRAFSTLSLNVGGIAREVTALKRLDTPRRRGGPASFVSSDGVPFTAVRFRHLPLPVYAALRAARAWG